MIDLWHPTGLINKYSRRHDVSDAVRSSETPSAERFAEPSVPEGVARSIRPRRAREQRVPPQLASRPPG